jgi:hypothetical protein
MQNNTVLGTMVIFALCVAPAGAQTGNGAPSGGHYNLNILGKTTCAGDDLTGSNRHTIQVLLNFDDGNNTGELLTELDRRNKIFLAEGEFQVLDGNACDGDGAKFQLPANPFTSEDTDPIFQGYYVYVRALGKPGGSATITTCAAGAGDDGVLHTADDEVICSTENVVLVRESARSKFTNKTKELTTIVADIDGDGLVERVGIFDDSLHTYFWDYDNQGLRLAQLRFYPVAD